MVQRRTKAQTRLAERYGPWAVVTGASDGIGRETALRLAEAGVNVVLVARREPVLERVAREIGTQTGVQTRVLRHDLANPASVAELDEETRDLDVGLLVAAAGFGTSGHLLDGDLDAELAMVDVNCRAVVGLTHRFGRRFAERGRGGLVLLSSIVAFQGVPNAANYAATKAFVQSLAEGIRPELAARGVDVVASAPGPVHSGFAARAGMQMGAALTPKDVAQETLDALGRWTTVRPGFLSKLLGWSLRTAPRFLRTIIMSRIMAGMTKRLPAGRRTAA